MEGPLGESKAASAAASHSIVSNSLCDLHMITRPKKVSSLLGHLEGAKKESWFMFLWVANGMNLCSASAASAKKPFQGPFRTA